MWTSVQFCLAEDSPGSLNESVECLELCGNRLNSGVPGIHCSHCACASPQRVHWYTRFLQRCCKTPRSSLGLQSFLGEKLAQCETQLSINDQSGVSSLVNTVKL